MGPTRDLERLKIVSLGVQRTRFGRGLGRNWEDEQAPPISAWRCNLTALSQTQNLYFVAYGTQIHVYQPTFPSQHLPASPALVVTSQPCRSGQRGYLDLSEPHSINNLVASLLGHDEIIATVRDDGDVTVILVRHIAQAIERRAEPGNTLPLTADEIKPIFQTNVGMSAWGLAVHSEARILATSSNRHEVRVFSFGLIPNGDQIDSPTNAAQTAPDSTRRCRQLDTTQRVLNGDANIPHISFCNTGDDPEGRWLLTTDVAGVCRVMDLHSVWPASAAVQSFRFGKSTDLWGREGAFDRINAGWCIAFLDRRSFYGQHDWNVATGFPLNQKPPKHSKGQVWDLSAAFEIVPGNSTTFSRHVPQRRTSPRGVDALVAPGTAGATAPTEDFPAAEGASLELLDSHSEMSLDATELRLGDEASSATGDMDEEDLVVDDGEGEDWISDTGETEESLLFDAMYGRRGWLANEVRFVEKVPLCDGLPCPILHASVKSVYLLQPGNDPSNTRAFTPPLVGFASPMRQNVEVAFSDLNVFDRMNMMASIPSLGAVIIASQKGRATILALTKMPSRSCYPPGMGPPEHAPKTIYAMRIESIVPFRHQEEADERPFAPLHGIAVGPLQGTEHVAPEHKRWRLMMMYQDHSILSYELSRSSLAEDSRVRLAQVHI